jgi:hypothetical protein
VPQQHLAQRLQLRRAVGRAARVRRRVDEEPARARRDGRFELRRLEPETVGLGARTDTGTPPQICTMSAYEVQYGAGRITSSPGFRLAISALKITCLAPALTLISSSAKSSALSR